MVQSNMADLLPLTALAIEDCRDHMSRHLDIDQVIVDYLVRHVNALLCAEIEREVSRLIRERLENGCSDAETLNYVLRYIRHGAVQNATFQEIKQKLSYFDDSFGEKFDRLVRNSIGDEGIGRLSLAVEKRNATSHDSPPSITFGELDDAFSAATVLVDSVRATLAG